MIENGRTKLALIAAAAILGLSVVAPTFAWNATLNTTIYCMAPGSTWVACSSVTSIPAGTMIKDKATLTLTADGGPYGTIRFYLYSGTYNTAHTCAQNVASATLFWTDPSNPYSVTGTGTTTYYSTAPSSIPSGSYFFYVTYSGTGVGGYPAKSTCEPFSTLGFPPPNPVPQFPLGMGLLLAAAIPGLLLVRSRFSSKQAPLL